MNLMMTKMIQLILQVGPRGFNGPRQGLQEPRQEIKVPQNGQQPSLMIGGTNAKINPEPWLIVLNAVFVGCSGKGFWMRTAEC